MKRLAIVAVLGTVLFTQGGCVLAVAGLLANKSMNTGRCGMLLQENSKRRDQIRSDLHEMDVKGVPLAETAEMRAELKRLDSERDVYFQQCK